MNLWPTAADLAGLPGMPAHKTNVIRKAQAEGWVSKKEPVRGGQLIRYALESLPTETRLALALRDVAQASADDTPPPILAPGLLSAHTAGEQLRDSRKREDRAAADALLTQLTGKRAQDVTDKVRVLVLFRRFWDKMGGPLCPAMQAFCEAWNAGQVPAPAALRERWPRLGRWKTVLEWWLKLDRKGGAGLARPPSHRSGRFEVLEGTLGQVVLAIMHEKPHLGGTQIRRLLSLSQDMAPLGIDQLPSDRAFRRAVAHWKKENAQLFTLMTNPDQWRSHYMSAAGSRSDGLGPNDLWEMDGTKADLLLADGRRWTLTAVVDVGSRRAMLRLSPSARAAVVMGLTRRAMGEWGIPRHIKTDNGSDYVANQFQLALTQIDPEMQKLCDPYQPQQKPHVERFIGTLLHDLFELLPGFVGHDVAQAQDIRARQSFAERLTKRTDEGGPVELRLQPEQLQDILETWLDGYHARPHEGLRGRSPNQVMEEWSGTVHKVNERALDIFLAPAGTSGLRTVTKKGISLDHGTYNCAELGGLEGKQVQVKQDEADIGKCYVFDLAGRYVGLALDHARLGISVAEVAAERAAHQHKTLVEQKAAVKASVKAHKPAELIMRVVQRKTDAAVDASPKVTRLRPVAEHTSEAIASVLAAPAPGAPQISAAAAQTLARMDAGQMPAPAPVLRLDTPNTRYSAYVRLQVRKDRGEAIDPRDLKWADGYGTTSEFKAMQRLHQGADPLAAEAGA
jgi:putative transposase